MSDKNLFPRLRVGSVIIVAVSGLATMLPTSGPGVAHAAPAESTALPPMPEVSGPVHDVPAGGALPSEATCAARVQRVAESRPQNASANQTRGSSPNNENPRVTGNFVGTTDEIIQWAACKWGLDPSWARAQALVESFWIQSTVGDNGESFGLLQVRRPYHQSAFEGENAVRSTAYNADYAWSIWRRCFNGEYTWLNTVERGRNYAAGDSLGCIGLWFAGRWYTDAAVGYMNRVAGTSVPSTPSPPSRPSAPRSLDGTAGIGYACASPGRRRSATVGPRSPTTSSNAPGMADAPGVALRRRLNTSRLYSCHGSGERVHLPIPRRSPQRSRLLTGEQRRDGDPRATIAVAAPILGRGGGASGGVGSGQVRLSWTAPAYTGGYPITDYVIQRSWDGGRTWTSLSDGLNDQPHRSSSRATRTGRRYYFRVAARNGRLQPAQQRRRPPRRRAPTSLAATVTASALPEPTTATATAPPTTGPSTTRAPRPSTSTSTSTTTTAPVDSDDAGSIGDLVWLDAERRRPAGRVGGRGRRGHGPPARRQRRGRRIDAHGRARRVRVHRRRRRRPTGSRSTCTTGSRHVGGRRAGRRGRFRRGRDRRARSHRAHRTVRRLRPTR